MSAADEGAPRELYDIAVVGAGPGGMTAAIYSSRARLATVVLERNTAGGIMSVTERIENYPGFPEGITGFELAEKMKQQAGQFGAELREITGVLALEQRADGAWRVTTDEDTLVARAVILSPGVEARKLGVPGEAEFMGRGVSYCATCDGPLYRDKEVVVIGGGNAAVEEGMFLARFASTVHVVHRRDALRATAIAQERAFSQPNMHFIWNGRVRRIVGETKVEAVDYDDVLDGSSHTLPVSGVFFYVGQLPQTEFLRGLVELDEGGYIVTDTRLRRAGRALRLRRRARRPHQADRQRGRRGRPRGHRSGALPRRARLCRPSGGRRRRNQSQEGHVDAVTQDTFKAEVLDAPGKVLVDFWAEWCGPCRAVEPMLAEIAERHPGVKVVKLNVDENPQVAQSLEVMNIPTLLAYEGGELKKRIVGALSKPKLTEQLADWLD